MDFFATFQQLVAEVPTWLQPLILALAGAVPFVEGEGGATIGVLGGVNPVLAAVSAALGNFLCVAILVWLSARARALVVHKVRSRAAQPVLIGAGNSSDATNVVLPDAEPAAPATSPRQVKFQRALSRYGVPGVSLLGPLLLPTQFTATMLAAAGVRTARVLLWQAIAITMWTTIITVLIAQLVHAISAS